MSHFPPARVAMERNERGGQTVNTNHYKKQDLNDYLSEILNKNNKDVQRTAKKQKFCMQEASQPNIYLRD